MIYSIPSQGASFHDSWSSTTLRHARYSPATYSNVIPLTSLMYDQNNWLGPDATEIMFGFIGIAERSLSSFTGFDSIPIVATRPVWADTTVQIITGGWYDIQNKRFITSYENTLFPHNPSYITTTYQSKLSALRKGFMWIEIAVNSLGQVLTSQSLDDNPIYIRSTPFASYTTTGLSVSGIYNNTNFKYLNGFNNLWPRLFPTNTSFNIERPNWTSLNTNLQPIVETLTVNSSNAISSVVTNMNNTSSYIPVISTEDITFTSTVVGFANTTNSQTSSKIYIDNNLITLCSNMSAAVDSRLVGKDPTNSKVVFSTANHTTLTYVRNTNLWCADLVQQLTGMVTYKKDVSNSNDSYGGTLITPRHVLYVQHAVPRGGVIRFVTATNQTITANQIVGSDADSTVYPVFPSVSAIDPYFNDMCVITLDRDVSLSGISPLPIAAITPRERTILRLQPATTIAISQGSTRSTGITNPNPLSARGMELYTLKINFNSEPTTSSKYPWVGNGGGHKLWDGDSGTSHLLISNNNVYLYRLTRFAHGDGATVAALSAQLNHLIRKSEERVSINTGLSATYFTVSQILTR